MGKIAFTMTNQKSSTGQQVTDSITIVISNVVADPNQCRVSYHRKATKNGRTFKNQDYTFSLREVQKITIQTYEQAGNEYVAANNTNHGVVSLSTSPQAVELSLHQNHGAGNFFNFTDTDLAERLAKAFNHAVELCGGGEKQELF
jgi:hypothetical protein